MICGEKNGFEIMMLFGTPSAPSAPRCRRLHKRREWSNAPAAHDVLIPNP
jgi:hypothetical protein